MYYCVYHRSFHEDAEPSTKEHIVPLSIGGSNSLTITTCKQSNSDLGTLVDAPLINNPLIATERVRLGLTGHSGEPPSLDLIGTVDLGGVARRGSLRVSADRRGEEQIRIIPIVEKSVEGDQTNYTIRCMPQDEARILRDIEKKERRHGNRRITVGARQEINNSSPVLNSKANIDVLALQRAFCKMALSFGYFIIGNALPENPDTELLRQFIWEENRAKAMAIPLKGSCWPEHSKDILRLWRVKDYHLLALQNPGPLIFTGLLFGTYGCTLQLCEDGSRFTGAVPREQGVAVWIDPSDRIMHRESLLHFLGQVPQLRQT